MAARRTEVKYILTLLLALIAGVARAREKEINVKDYGARGDGISDDTDAIQRALNSGRAAGAVIRLPVGTYYISSALKMSRSNTTLQCSASNNTIILGAVNQRDRALIRFGGAEPTSNLSNIGVFDCQLKGQWSRASPNPALLAHAANLGGHIISHVWLARNRFVNTSMGVALGAVFLQRGDNFIRITDNRFENTDIQLSAPADVEIVGNQLLDPFDVAISVGASGGDYAFRSLIDSNIVRRAPQSSPQGGSIEVGGCTHCRISNNEVTGAYGPGINCWSQTGRLYPRHLQIVNNIVASNSNDKCDMCGGIYLESPYDATIEGNRIVNNNGTGITVTGTNANPAAYVAISRNLVKDNGIAGSPINANGIDVSGTKYATIRNNTVIDTRGRNALQGQGIKIDGASDDRVTSYITLFGNVTRGNALNDVLITSNPLGPVYVGEAGHLRERGKDWRHRNGVNPRP